MDDFFENLGKRIADTVDELGKKAGDTIDIQRLRNQISTLQRANEREFAAIGKKIYEQFKDGEIGELDFISSCEAIEKREGQIEGLEKAISQIKGE